MAYPNLRAEFARKGIRQVDIAKALGLKSAAVSRKMHGFNDWKLEECRKLAKLLEYEGTIDVLFYDPELDG